MKIMSVVGTRPNFMKIAPLFSALKKHQNVRPILVHTGQHYDEKMSDLFFRQLEIPAPDINLGVGSSSHAVQTAEIMKGFEPVVQNIKPDLIVVVGDVNSTVACGLVAVKMGVKLVHVEAGLRSGDRSMPEEINRIVTDSISDYLFCSESSGIDNLKREGVAEAKMFLVGNVMIDTLLKHKQKAEALPVLDKMGLEDRNYVVVTMHRPSNVDDAEHLISLMQTLERIGHDFPVVFPVHPRTRQKLVSLSHGQGGLSQVLLVEPLGYLEFLKLMIHARMVLTDSGGIQEETTMLGVPCITMRENTERPVTVSMGTNRLAGTDPDKIYSVYCDVKDNGNPPHAVPPLWDGHASERITDILLRTG